MKSYILYNPISGNGTGKKGADKLCASLTDKEIVLQDVTRIKSYSSFLAALEPDDELILCGGDGTLNRFANALKGMELSNRVFMCGTGTGNDFVRDIGGVPGVPVEINKYLEHLPTVYVNGKERLFINGIGYGIDGYCCEIADQIRAKTDKPVNYTAIAIKGLLFYYHPTHASVTIDGVTREYDRVWLVPTMNGRYYGGGMNAAPAQDRLNPDHTVTVMMMGGYSRLHTLMVFPSIFEGKHIENKMVEEYTGKDITVKFDRPVALQIDGETVLNVTEYRVKAAE